MKENERKAKMNMNNDNESSTTNGNDDNVLSLSMCQRISRKKERNAEKRHTTDKHKIAINLSRAHPVNRVI